MMTHDIMRLPSESDGAMPRFSWSGVRQSMLSSFMPGSIPGRARARLRLFRLTRSRSSTVTAVGPSLRTVTYSFRGVHSPASEHPRAAGPGRRVAAGRGQKERPCPWRRRQRPGWWRSHGGGGCRRCRHGSDQAGVASIDRLGVTIVTPGRGPGGRGHGNQHNRVCNQYAQSRRPEHQHDGFAPA
jgi:hypothetical protein